MKGDKRPLFSIIIPTRNRSTLLKACLDSVVSQKCSDFECIVIDDGSTDETKQTVSNISDARLFYFFQNHQERSSARNRGLSKARGRFLCFVDDDDLLSENYLFDFAEYIQSPNYNQEILRTGYLKTENEAKMLKTILYKNNSYKNPIDFVLHYMCGIWSLCIPKAYLDQIRFPEEFPHWQDSFVILRLLAKYPFKQLESYNYIYRIHDDMGSRHVVSADQLLERANINVAAMEHFEQNHFQEIAEYTEKGVFDYLKAEKLLQYASMAKRSGFANLSKSLFKRSWQIKRSMKFLKYYLRLMT